MVWLALKGRFDVISIIVPLEVGTKNCKQDNFMFSVYFHDDYFSILKLLPRNLCKEERLLQYLPSLKTDSTVRVILTSILRQTMITSTDPKEKSIVLRSKFVAAIIMIFHMVSATVLISILRARKLRYFGNLIRLKAGFHLCGCGRATRAIARRQSRKTIARLRDQGPEHAY